jgi:predicted RNase H-like HicB family nuclease
MKHETIEAHGTEFIVVIEPDEEDGGYIVHCPTLKGCWSQGETVDEALVNITDAIVGCLAVRVEQAMGEMRAKLEVEPSVMPLNLPIQVVYG